MVVPSTGSMIQRCDARRAPAVSAAPPRRARRASGTARGCSARHMRSASRSAAVTRSIRPFFWTCQRAGGNAAAGCGRRPAPLRRRSRGRGDRAAIRPASSSCARPCRPRAGARSATSSMKLRMKKIPRPLDFSTFSGSSGLAIGSGIEALRPRRARCTTNSSGFARAAQAELDDDVLGCVLAVAVLDGVDDRLAHGHADPVRGVLVQPGHRRQPVARGPARDPAARTSLAARGGSGDRRRACTRSK